MKQKIVCVGSSNTDMILRTHRIPQPGETVLGGAFSTAAGGKGANQAVAAARAGGEVSFIARFGDDMLGRKAREELARDGIDLDGSIVDSSAPSGVAFIFVDDQGQNSIGVAPGANGNLSIEDVEQHRGLIEGAGILLMQLEIPLATIERAAAIAAEAGVKTILDPAPAVALSETLLSRIDIVTPNESEAEILTGLSVKTAGEAEAAGRRLLEMGAKVAIVTLGAQGALVVTGEGVERVAGYPVRAVDSTAAGDTFAGALAVGLAEGLALREAVAFANRAAALSVMTLGAQPSIPTRAQIEAFGG